MARRIASTTTTGDVSSRPTAISGQKIRQLSHALQMPQLKHRDASSSADSLDSVWRISLNDVLDVDSVFERLDIDESGSEMRVAVLEEAAKFCENVLAPLNQSGDEEGCKWSEEGVSTPTGFKEAYRQFVDNGWAGLSGPVDFGGMGLAILVELQPDIYPKWTVGCTVEVDTYCVMVCARAGVS